MRTPYDVRAGIDHDKNKNLCAMRNCSVQRLITRLIDSHHPESLLAALRWLYSFVRPHRLAIVGLLGLRLAFGMEPKGAKVRFSLMMLLTIADGKIIEKRAHFDRMDIRKQLTAAA